jgi:voltage-gated potassium channel
MKRNSELIRQRNNLLHRIEQLLEGPMILLGFLWLVLLIIELIWGLTPVLEMISLAIWIIFIIDFLLKLTLAPQKITFIKKNWLTIISLAIPALRVVRILRFARLLRSLRGIRLVKIVASLNRSMRSLNATMRRRGFVYVVLLTLFVMFSGAAGMYAFEKDVAGGLENYGRALWWTAMLIITIGSDYWPQTPEGRSLCFLLSLYGFSIFGYITATLASFFVGRDAEEKNAPVAGAEDIKALQKEIQRLARIVEEQARGRNDELRMTNNE